MMNPLRILLLTLLTLVIFSTEMLAQDWQAAAKMSEVRDALSTVELSDGRILISGGGTDWETPTASVDIFDYRNNSVTAAAPLPTPLLLHESVLLQDGRVLVVGGGAEVGEFSNRCFLYNPELDSWSEAGSMLNRRSEFGLFLLQDGRVMVVGGLGGAPDNNENLTLPDCEFYDPATNIWTAAPPLPRRRNTFAPVMLPNGQILAPNGYISGGSPSQACQLFDPATNSWVETGPFVSDGTGSHAMCLTAEGNVLRSGGWPGPVGTSELYNVSTGEWASVGSLNEARHDHAQVLLSDGRILAIGGALSTGGETGQASRASVEEFNPESRTWSLIEPLPEPLTTFGAHVLRNGQVVVIGGALIDGRRRELASDDIYVSNFEGLGPEPSAAGTVFYNLDGMPERGLNDPAAGDVKIVALPGPYYTTTDAQGRFEFPLPAGDYTICIADDPNWSAAWTRDGEACYQVSILPGREEINNLDFGLQALRNVQELDLALVGTQPQLNAPLTYTLTYRNSGHSEYSGLLTFSYDGDIEFINSSVTPTAVEGNTISWMLQELEVGEFNTIELDFNVPDDFSLLGRELCADLLFERDNGDEILRGGMDSFCDEVREAAEPNFFVISPRGQGSVASLNYTEELTLSYTIYFQNSGPGSARDVTVITNLNEHLDWDSFEFGASSHPAEVLLFPNGTLRFSMPNADLVATDGPGSRGFVRFYIKPNNPAGGANLVLGLAQIRMDGRVPMQTNGVVRTIVGGPSSVDASLLNTVELSSHPNPVAETLTVSGFNKMPQSVQLFNMRGQALSCSWQSAGSKLTVDCAALNSGSYVLNLVFADGATGSLTFLIQR